MIDLDRYAQCLQLQQVKTTGRETIFICPFCSTNRKAYPKLYINAIKGVFICHHCHLEGSITDLWAIRCGVDTKTAYKQMLDLVPLTVLDKRPEEPVIVRNEDKIHAVMTH
jgi:transcription elongation factor Elf1